MKRTMLSLAAATALGLGYAAPADAQGRGGQPTLTPSKLRAVPAETTAAKVKDPNWKAPYRVGHPDLSSIWTSDDMRGIPTTRPAGRADASRSRLRNSRAGGTRLTRPPSTRDRPA